MDNEDLGLLRSFAAVAEERGFTSAARKLGVSTSALSHAVRKLEDRTGVRLLARTTRSVAPTEAGRRLLEQVRPAFADIGRALDALGASRDRPAGPLRVVASITAVRMFLGAKLTRFAREHPDVVLEVSQASSIGDLVAAGYDAGVHLGEFLDQDMISLRLTPDQRAAVVGSPDYFKDHETPTHPRDLARHRCIAIRLKNGLYRWEFEKRGRELTVRGPWAMIVDDLELMIQAARDGAGLAWAFETTVEQDLKRGALVRVLEDWCAPFPGFYLYYPRLRHKPPALAALIEALRP